jgi:hypothetical protein
MTRQVRTSVRFDPETRRALKLRAGREGRSVASLVREAVAHHLDEWSDRRAPRFGDDPADALVGLLRAEVDDESDRHDERLYGSPAESNR